MSTIQLNGVTVYVSAIESVEDGVSKTFDLLWDRAVSETMLRAYSAESVSSYAEQEAKVVYPEAKDHPAVVVKLTSGREFRIVGKTRGEVENDILWAKRRGDNG